MRPVCDGFASCTRLVAARRLLAILSAWAPRVPAAKRRPVAQVRALQVQGGGRGAGRMRVFTWRTRSVAQPRPAPFRPVSQAAIARCARTGRGRYMPCWPTGQ